MSLRKTWDVANISQQIYRMARESSSPYTDGFTAFEIKKELYELKFIIDSVISSGPQFNGEQEWLTEQEKKRIIKILKS